MNDFFLNGVGTMTGGVFDEIKIDGCGKCTGDLKAKHISVDGSFQCMGSVETELLDCDGASEFESYIKATKIDVDGMMKVKNGTRIEAEEILCDGLIRIEGEISADRIKAHGCISANEIVGDHIVIKSHASKFLRLFSKDLSTVQLIEATTIELRGVTAGSVNGQDIRIGPHCRIGNLDCSGTLYIDPKAEVKNITGSYTRVSE